MKRRAITVTLVVGSLAAGLDRRLRQRRQDEDADPARHRGRPPAHHEAQRGASWADAQAKLKAGNFEAVAVTPRPWPA